MSVSLGRRRQNLTPYSQCKAVAVAKAIDDVVIDVKVFKDKMSHVTVDYFASRMRSQFYGVGQSIVLLKSTQFIPCGNKEQCAKERTSNSR